MIIDQLLCLEEGKTLEFKENLESLNSIIKTIIAFANTSGGIIIIGIEDKTKKVVGVENPLLQEERLTGSIHNNIAPLLMPDIQIYTYQDKELILINVPHATGPYYLKSKGLENGTYIRLGSTTRLADAETIQALKNFARNVFFDELPYVTGSKDDLNWEIINLLFRSVKKEINEENVQNLGILVNHNNKIVPSFGGIILFGKNRLKLFPESIIRCVRFAGNTRDIIIDQFDAINYLPLALDEVIKFIKRNTKLGSEIVGLRRKDIPEYPPQAVREAIINAIVHADYAISGVYISVAIFENRIEITNPGSLPFGITIEKALAGASRIRNRVIAKVFYNLKLIEQWGRGINIIMQECQDAGLEDPKFEELNNQFRVTLYSAKKAKKHLVKNDKVLEFLEKEEKINTQKAAELWNITPRAARLRLIKLVQNNSLKRVADSLYDPKSFYTLKN